MLRYTDGVFTDGTYLCTIGVDFRFKSVNVNKKTIRLQVCDTVGQSRFRTVARAQYRGIHGVLITFDLTCHKSFESVSASDLRFDATSTRPMCQCRNRDLLCLCCSFVAPVATGMDQRHAGIRACRCPNDSSRDKG